MTDRNREWIGTLAFLAILLALAVFAGLSGPPSPHQRDHAPQNYSDNRTQAPNNYGSATPSAPLAVEVYAAPKTAEATARDERERDEKSTNDRALVILTGLVAFFTLVLATATMVIVTSGERNARRGLRAYIGTEPNGTHFQSRLIRPKRPVNMFGESRDLADPPYVDDIGAVKYFDLNNGQTPAKDIVMFVRVQDGAEAPAVFDYPLLPAERQAVIGYALPRQNIGKIIETPSRKLYLKTDTFFLYGYTDYTDIFGHRWRHRFAFSYDPFRGADGTEAWEAHGTHNDEIDLGPT